MKSPKEHLDLKGNHDFSQQEILQYVDNCLLLSNEIEKMIEQQEKIEVLQRTLKTETLKLETQMKRIQALSKFKILKCQKSLKEHRENLNQISDIYGNELEHSDSAVGECLDLYDSFHNIERDSISTLNKVKETEHDDDDQHNRPNLSFKDDFSDSDSEEESKDSSESEVEEYDQLFTATNEEISKLFSKLNKFDKNSTENLPENVIIDSNDSPNLKKNRITTKEGLFKTLDPSTKAKCLFEHPRVSYQYGFAMIKKPTPKPGTICELTQLPQRKPEDSNVIDLFVDQQTNLNKK